MKNEFPKQNNFLISSLAYRLFWIVGIVFFLVSCGQVGTITGGNEDKTAPQMRLSKVNPPMGSTNVSPKKIVIPFDEYIELSKPAENIRVVPSDVKLDYSIQNKSLVLKKKEGEWEPNTTYTIYLNRAVKDITEGNDSIMSYVFSTGNFLDSLQTAIQVQDGYTGKPVEGITIGLYATPLLDDTSKINPRYYSLTNAKGIAHFHNIKEGDFYVYAFEDANRNNRLDATERRAALNSPVVLYTPDTVKVAGPIIYLIPPQEKFLKITTNEVFPTANWSLKFNRPLEEDEEFRVLTGYKEMLWNSTKDSVNIYFESTANSGNVEGLLITSEKTDTVRKKYFFKNQPELKITDNIKGEKLKFVDTLSFTLNEPILKIDTSLFVFIEELSDSIFQAVAYDYIEFSPLTFGLAFEKNHNSDYSITIPPNTIQGINYTQKDTLKVEFSLQREKETGTMIIEFDTIPPYGILYITNRGNKEVTEVIFDGISKQNHQIPHLEPGKYGFHYLIDENQDGKWTSGSIFTDSKPEKIIWFTNETTIRGNWEVKSNLEIKE